jgi:hypothetical protein
MFPMGGQTYVMPAQPQGWPAQPQMARPGAMVPSQPPGWSSPPAPQTAMPAPPPGRQTQPSSPALASADMKPKVRAVPEDSPAPLPRLVLPTPESLGIQFRDTTAQAAAVDWNAVHARLEQLGISNFQRERLAQGSYRVILALGTRQVEATGATEAAAMVTALQRAESLVTAVR